MADVTADFFDDLSKRGQEPLLGGTRTTVRFDIDDAGHTDRWLLVIRDGVLDVTHGTGDADCVIHASKADFDLVAGGRRNPMAAALRGTLTIEGDPRLMVRLQRLFPDPVGMPEVSGDRAVGKRRS
ncbi:MAG TPA: SCP2 sterol-binding domain-containing protein [Candidatus Limnocylindrales bacterium]